MIYHAVQELKPTRVWKFVATYYTGVIMSVYYHFRVVDPLCSFACRVHLHFLQTPLMREIKIFILGGNSGQFVFLGEKVVSTDMSIDSN